MIRERHVLLGSAPRHGLTSNCCRSMSLGTRERETILQMLVCKLIRRRTAEGGEAAHERRGRGGPASSWA